MDGVVLQLVAHQASHSRRGDPSLTPEDGKCLRHGVLRSTQRGRQIADTDAGRPMQAEQDLQSVGVAQQIETLCPPGDVDVRQRRRRSPDRYLITSFHTGILAVTAVERPGLQSQDGQSTQGSEKSKIMSAVKAGGVAVRDNVMTNA